MAFNLKQFFNKTTNVALFVGAVLILVVGSVLLYMQLNPAVHAVIEAPEDIKVTVQAFDCKNSDIYTAPYTEKMLKAGTNHVVVHTRGKPKRVRISVNSGKVPNLTALYVKQIATTDLLPGVTAKVSPIGPGPSETLAGDVLPIPLKSSSITVLNISSDIHNC